MKTCGLLTILTVSEILTGCGAWNRTVQDLANSQPPQLPGNQIDRLSGNYKGRPIQVISTSANCPHDNQGKIAVGDSTLYFSYTPQTIFIAPIQRDGRVRAVSGTSLLEGTVRDGRMVMTVTTPVCETRYDLRWVL